MAVFSTGKVWKSQHTGMVSFLLVASAILFLMQQYLLSHVSVRGNEGLQPRRGDVWVETISEDPKIMYIHNLCTKDEAEHLISLGEIKGMNPALITPYGSSELVQSTVRTNSAAWLDYQQDEIVSDIENKIAEVTNTQPEQGESIQILHYKKGQQFERHRDCYEPSEDPPELFEQGGNRYITAVIYLRTPEKGGETYFPELNKKLKAKPGDALLFWNLLEGGVVDGRVEHAGLPPIVGEKWVGTKWIHQGNYQYAKKPAKKLVDVKKEVNGDNNNSNKEESQEDSSKKNEQASAAEEIVV